KLITEAEQYFRQYKIPTVYIGQTEAYSVEYPVVEYMARQLGISPQRYLVTERTLVNNMMKKSSIGEKYLDIYCYQSMMKSDGKKTYMYDADHFSEYGTNQYEELFLRKIFHTSE